MQEQFTIKLFHYPVKTIFVPDDIFDNLIFKATKEINPALYQKSYYQIYYAISNYLQPKSILEIGSRFGYSLIAMSKGTNISITSIDLQSYDNPFDLSSQEIAKANLKSCCGLDGEFIVGDSRVINLNQKYDLIHIDGDHSEEVAFLDMQKFVNYLSPQGVMMVDDLDDPRVWRAWEKFKVNYRSEFIPHKHGLGLLMF